MAKSGRKTARSGGAGKAGLRWIVSLSAIGMAILTIYVLMNNGGGKARPDAAGQRTQQSLDDIDAESREAMRDLLRDAGE
jgi:hypothetical protein